MKHALWFYITSLLLFGTNGIAASRIDLPSEQIVFWRTLIGSLLLFALFFARKSKPTFQRHKRQFAFLCLSGIAMGGSWMLLYEAYNRIGVGIASLLYYCGPVLVMAISPIIFREILTKSVSISLAAVLVGIVFVTGRPFGRGDTVGLICGALSAVLYAVMVISNKKASRITGLENAMLQLFISFLTVALCLSFRQTSALSVSRSDMLPVLLLGLVNTGLGCYLYFSAIGRLPVQTVAIFGYLEPLSAVFFSVVLLKEPFTLLQVLGALLILGGACFAERNRLR